MARLLRATAASGRRATAAWKYRMAPEGSFRPITRPTVKLAQKSEGYSCCTRLRKGTASAGVLVEALAERQEEREGALGIRDGATSSRRVALSFHALGIAGRDCASRRGSGSARRAISRSQAWRCGRRVLHAAQSSRAAIRAARMLEAPTRSATTAGSSSGRSARPASRNATEVLLVGRGAVDAHAESSADDGGAVEADRVEAGDQPEVAFGLFDAGAERVGSAFTQARPGSFEGGACGAPIR